MNVAFHRPLRSLHLFAGAGGGILGDLLLGHVPVCAVELEAYPRSVLLQRQRDGLLPWFPIWDDVRTFDGTHWRGRVDVICGGFPCQDISVAGGGVGITGARSGLWKEFSRVIGEVQPRFVFVENSPALTVRGLGTVLGDLARLGFDAEWGVLGADDAGAIHRRNRIWVLGSNSAGQSMEDQALGHPSQEVFKPGKPSIGPAPSVLSPGWAAHQPGMAGMADGMADWVGRSKAIGNGQCPQQAALAWETLMTRIEKQRVAA